MRMNHKLRTGLGIVCFFFGGVSFINAIFVEKSDFDNESVVSAVRAIIALSLFGVGYLLIRKKQLKIEKPLN